MADYLTWQDFQNLVATQLPMDAGRIGLETFYPQMVRNAVYDLQDYIKRYRQGHESVYYATDFYNEGCASVGTLPPFSSIRDCWVSDLGTKSKAKCLPYYWDKRYDLVHNRVIHFSGQPLMSISPEYDKFYIYPHIHDRKVLSVNYDGFKLNFSPNDATPFDEDCAQAVADYVAARIAKYVEHDEQRSQSFMQSYALKRKNLFIRSRSN